MSVSQIERVTQYFYSTHVNDRDYVGGHGHLLSITDTPVYGDYNLMLPGQYDVDAIMSAYLLVYGCMDRRQSADVYSSLAINGLDRILTTSAGGAEQRKSRFDNDVAFWSQVMMSSPKHPELALLIHLRKCGGAVAQETEPVVMKWISDGTEETNMIARAVSMRDAIWQLTHKKGNISIGCVYLNESDQFAGIRFK